MPAASLTYAERASRIPPGHVLWRSITDADYLMETGLLQDAGATFQVKILEVCPGFVYSPASILLDSRRLGYVGSTLAHLLELLRGHRDLLKEYTRVYAVDGPSRLGASPDKMVAMPYFGQIRARSAALEVGVRRVRNDDEVFHGHGYDGREGFVFLEPSGQLDDLCCSGCNSK